MIVFSHHTAQVTKKSLGPRSPASPTAALVPAIHPAIQAGFAAKGPAPSLRDLLYARTACSYLPEVLRGVVGMVSILFRHPGKIQVSTGRRKVGRRPGSKARRPGSKAKKGQKTRSVGCVKGPCLGELKAFSGSQPF